MAVEDIGVQVPTKIPTLSSDADIQTALRIYHYGSEDFPFNSDSATLITNSIAGRLADLDSRLDTISSTVAVDVSQFQAKGDMLVGKNLAQYDNLAVGTDGFVLTADSSATLGMSWKNPEVTQTNQISLSNKTLVSPRISDSGLNISDSSGNELISFIKTASAVNEITVTNAATAGKPTISATGGDTNITLNLVSKGTGTIQANGVDVVTTTGTQTLTNKTISSITVNGNTLSFPAITGAESVITSAATQTMSNKTITVANTTFNDSNGDKNFTIRANAGMTSGVALSTPPSSSSDTLVGIAATQTLTNKTLTSPVINTSITSASTSVSMFSSTVTTLNIGSSSTATAFTGTVTVPNSTTSTGLRIGTAKIYVGSATPSGASAGDIWLRTV